MHFLSPKRTLKGALAMKGCPPPAPPLCTPLLRLQFLQSGLIRLFLVVYEMFSQLKNLAVTSPAAHHVMDFHFSK